MQKWGNCYFANRTNTVQTIINRIIELKNRGYELAEIKKEAVMPKK